MNLYPLLILCFTLGLSANPDVTGWYTAPAGNPFVDGFYADPDVMVDKDGTIWVYATISDVSDRQKSYTAWSSTDLINWETHGSILDISAGAVSWATDSLWAPAPHYDKASNKYFLYFSANNQNATRAQANLIGGIGVAISDSPTGPFKDAIGKPLIGDVVEVQVNDGTNKVDVNPIDQSIFVDDDDQAYMLYGGGHALIMLKLNADLISVGTFANGETHLAIDIKGLPSEVYREGAYLFKRNGIYYLMWSQNNWTSDTYQVAYATSENVTGPYTTFDPNMPILVTDPAVARGPGHHTILHLPDSDDWFIVYHRRAPSETNINNRVLCYERINFATGASVAPGPDPANGFGIFNVSMAVMDKFTDRNLIGWTSGSGPAWSADHDAPWGAHSARAATKDGTSLLRDTDFSDQVMTVTVRVDVFDSSESSAGMLLRVQGTDPLDFKGYFVGVQGKDRDRVVLTYNDNGRWKEIKKSKKLAGTGIWVNLRVEVIGKHFIVSASDFYDDGPNDAGVNYDDPLFEADDDRMSHGKNGLWISNADAMVTNVGLGRPSPQ